jgi:hypothetical protein
MVAAGFSFISIIRGPSADDALSLDQKSGVSPILTPYDPDPREMLHS